MDWKVPYFDLRLDEREKQSVLEVLDSNWLTSGPKIEKFELSFQKYFNSDIEAVSVSSATAALHIALVCFDVGVGDEVILPTFTFVACANVIRSVGATPVFVDITSENDWNLSISDVASKITSRTKVIMAVHYAGYPCDLKKLNSLTDGTRIKILEDCSHAPLVRYKKSMLGSFGDIGCFSFYSNKNMTTGEGGMLISSSQEIISRARILRSHGITNSTIGRFRGHSFGYDVAEVGFNYRLDELRAAIGMIQLKKLSENQKKREVAVRNYNELLTDYKEVLMPFQGRKEKSGHHIFPILIKNDKIKRDRVIEKMKDHGVQCSVHYKSIHTFSAYQSSDINLPKSEKVSSSLISLPLFPDISPWQQYYVIDCLKKCI